MGRECWRRTVAHHMNSVLSMLSCSRLDRIQFAGGLCGLRRLRIGLSINIDDRCYSVYAWTPMRTTVRRNGCRRGYRPTAPVEWSVIGGTASPYILPVELLTIAHAGELKRRNTFACTLVIMSFNSLKTLIVLVAVTLGGMRISKFVLACMSRHICCLSFVL